MHRQLLSSGRFLQTVPIISIENLPLPYARLVLTSWALTFLSPLNFFINEAYTVPLLCFLHNALQTGCAPVLA